MTRRAFAVGAALVVVAAVAAGVAWAMGAFRGPEPITGVDWHLESDRRASFRIDGTELKGTDSCNRIFGDASVSEGEPMVIEFGVLASTRMACPDGVDTQEAMRVALEGRRLVERPDEGTIVLVDEATGNSWRFVK
ncbi:META domain protein [Corynebacterium hansenii]|nr:META domain protein [Corynebacterium hansenii]